MESDLITLTLSQRKIIAKACGLRISSKTKFMVSTLRIYDDVKTSCGALVYGAQPLRIDFECIEIMFLKKKNNAAKTNICVSRSITNEI